MDREGPNCVLYHVGVLFILIHASSIPGHRNGPNEFHITGSLKTWSIIDRLHNIQATTLLINGRYDEAQDTVVEPFFQNIPKVRWVQFADSAHVPQLEETERFMQVVWAFLRA